MRLRGKYLDVAIHSDPVSYCRKARTNTSLVSGRKRLTSYENKIQDVFKAWRLAETVGYGRPVYGNRAFPLNTRKEAGTREKGHASPLPPLMNELRKRPGKIAQLVEPAM